MLWDGIGWVERDYLRDFRSLPDFGSLGLIPILKIIAVGSRLRRMVSDELD
jgi:hypothetical protein